MRVAAFRGCCCHASMDFSPFAAAAFACLLWKTMLRGVNHESKEFTFASVGLMLDLIIRRRHEKWRNFAPPVVAK